METAILIVDDEQHILSALKRALRGEPYLIIAASNGEEALDIVLHRKISVVVSDERMPGMSGVDLLSNVKRLAPEVVRIMLTGQTRIESAMGAVNQGEIFRFFLKPWDDFELKTAIRSAVHRYRLEERNRKLLEIAQRQARKLKSLELKFPDLFGNGQPADTWVVIPEISQSEMESVMREIESELEDK